MKRKVKRQNFIGFVIITIVGIFFLSLLLIYAFAKFSHEKISQYNVFIIDVTDRLSPQQKGELINNLETYINESPKNSWHEFYQVGSTKDNLLEPLLKSKSVYSTVGPENYLTSSPKRQRMLWQENFVAPLKKRLEESFDTPEAKESPILESIQSAAITCLNKSEAQKAPRRIILVSDLMQNTDSLNFYNSIPSFESLLKNEQYRRLRTNLEGVQFQIWRLNGGIAADADTKLTDLWSKIIYDQGAIMLPEIKISG